MSFSIDGIMYSAAFYEIGGWLYEMVWREDEIVYVDD